MESLLRLMHLISLATDTFGVITISLVSLLSLLGLLCIYRSLYFQLRIQRRRFLHLSYFNGPWVTRITLILISIWWGFGEIIRLSFLHGAGKLFSSQTCQKNVCKFYVLSNLGFAEPSVFLMLAFLLHAALQEREFTLSQRWNRKTIGCVVLLCFPAILWQLALVFIGPKFANREKSDKRVDMMRLFTSTSSLSDGTVTCTYPLLSTAFLGAFYIILITYVTYIGSRMLSLVINKGLRRRIYVLVFSVILFLPMRALLLGFSVLPRPGGLAYEAIAFLAFVMMLFCTMVGIVMLVYFPIADTLALGEPEHVEMEGVPFDDYY